MLALTLYGFTPNSPAPLYLYLLPLLTLLYITHNLVDGSEHCWLNTNVADRILYFRALSGITIAELTVFAMF